MDILIIVAWLALCGLAANIAQSKGRNGFSFFLLSFLLSPFIGILFALMIKADPVGQGKKKCRQCAEFAQSEAKICWHCGHGFENAGEGIESHSDIGRSHKSIDGQTQLYNEEVRFAAERAKPWLQRNGVELAILVGIGLYCIGLLWIASGQPSVSPSFGTETSSSPSFMSESSYMTNKERTIQGENSKSVMRRHHEFDPVEVQKINAEAASWKTREGCEGDGFTWDSGTCQWKTKN